MTRDGLRACVDLAVGLPLHMHIAEQTAEVDEVVAHYGQRPVTWLLDSCEVGPRWCLVHCTQLDDTETIALAGTGAVAGLCPITESSLGDGIFNGVAWLNASGKFGLGSDSNVRIALSEELRTLEYSQRLRDRGRARLATPEASTGRVMFDAVVAGGAQAIGRASGRIAVGHWADLMALDQTSVDLDGRRGDDILDTFVFAGDDRMVSELWSAGRHVVSGGRHVQRDAIAASYQRVVRALRDRI